MQDMRCKCLIACVSVIVQSTFVSICSHGKFSFLTLLLHYLKYWMPILDCNPPATSVLMVVAFSMSSGQLVNMMYASAAGA